MFGLIFWLLGQKNNRVFYKVLIYIEYIAHTNKENHDIF